MMKTVRCVAVFLAGVLLGSAAYASEDWWETNESEESAGSSISAQINPADGVYGMEWEDGTWIRRTPIFGNFFLTLFQNGIEDSTYAGMGMIVRLMPHSRVAPFIGAGGSYNYSFQSSDHEEETVDSTEQEIPEDLGESYWAWHGEAGVRVWTGGALGMIEILGRYTVNTVDMDRNYWLAGLAIGTGF